MSELTSLAPDSTYGDNADGRQRGQAFHLSSVLPALSSAIGFPISTAVHSNPGELQEALHLPSVQSAIVVVVDGLGFWNLKLRSGHVPYLRSLLGDNSNNRPIATCLPSTTTAAMGVFGTGTCPGLSGMAGYTQLNPATGSLAQLIQFKDAPEPEDLQRQPTIFQSLTELGVRVTSSGLPKFAYSGLTRAALRGTRYIGHNNARARIMAAAQSAKEPGLTYLYIRDIDKIGHASGWETEEWVAALEDVDAQLALLNRESPKGTLIVIVADHGMVSSNTNTRFDLADYPHLQQDVSLVGGEPRQVMLYLKDDADPLIVAQRWKAALGEKALIRTRQEIVSNGIIGPVDDRVQGILGDIFISSIGDATVVDSRTQADLATRLPGVHGSQTYLETDIPCLVDVV